MSIDIDLTHDSEHEPDEGRLETIGAPTSPERVVEVRRRAGPAVALGAGASLVAVAFLARATSGGGLLDWGLTVVLGLIGVANLAALLDARTPLLVADDLGVRLRLGRTWVGLPWGGLHEVEHRGRRGWWRDGMLVVHTHFVQRVLEDLDPPARRTARLNARLHQAPLAVPLGLGTRVVGADPDLVSALRVLADGRTPIVETGPEPQPEPQPESEPVVAMAPGPEPDLEADRPPAVHRLRDPRPAIAGLIGSIASRLDRPVTEESGPDEPDGGPDRPEAIVASPTPAPGRATVAAARAEVRHEARADLEEDPQEALPVEAAPIGMLTEPPPLDPVLDPVPDPVPDPVIGPQLAAARRRLGLGVDALAERTRIRPHVIEAIEVDDFSACGGDFYARGHLRTLARVLGVDGTAALATYDERYADAPIDPRRVFEAELAGAGSIRATRGGPNWSILVAAVMALILCWSVARLVTGGPDQGPDRAVLSGSGGPNHAARTVAKPVPVTVIAANGGARVVIRNGVGRLVFSGNLSYGQRHTVRAAPPVRVQSTDGALRVKVNGQDRGRMGPAGRPASQSYVVHR